VLAENLIAMIGKAFTELSPAASADPNDDPLGFGRAVVKHREEVRVEPLGVMLRGATPGGASRSIGDGEGRNHHCESERDISKHSSFHAVFHLQTEGAGNARVQKGHGQMPGDKS
jgi:hypothetical protein